MSEPIIPESLIDLNEQRIAAAQRLQKCMMEFQSYPGACQEYYEADEMAQLAYDSAMYEFLQSTITNPDNLEPQSLTILQRALLLAEQEQLHDRLQQLRTELTDYFNAFAELKKKLSGIDAITRPNYWMVTEAKLTKEALAVYVNLRPIHEILDDIERNSLRLKYVVDLLDRTKPKPARSTDT